MVFLGHQVLLVEKVKPDTVDGMVYLGVLACRE
jgi:hypothetical protein